jgi:hypothetical protein
MNHDGDKIHNTGYTIDTLAHLTIQLQTTCPTKPSSQGFSFISVMHEDVPGENRMIYANQPFTRSFIQICCDSWHWRQGIVVDRLTV